MNELKHYGILGMKWGVRRTPEQLGHKQEKVKRNKREDISKMSDDELRKRLNRVQMEKQLESLTKKKQSAGHEFVKKAMFSVGMMAVTGLAAAYIKPATDFIRENAGDMIKTVGNLGLNKYKWVL